jgi:ribosomal protein S24E
MKSSLAISVLVACFIFFSCKSTQKLFEEGRYERAFYSAINDLKKNPSNTSALQLIQDAYRHARSQLLSTVDAAQSGSETGDKLDRIYNTYNSLQKMYNAIVASPAANAIAHPADYSNELMNAAEEGAYFHYNNGLDLMSRGDKKGFQKAYQEFKTTDSYVPGYKDVIQLKAEALDQSVTNVVINNIRQQLGEYSINGSFLDNDIQNSLNNIGRNYYYKFYQLFDAQSHRVRVDQYMDILMYDIYFGRLAVNSYSYDVSKVIKEPSPNSKEVAKSITVTATVKVTRRVMDSRAAMDCRITDAENRRIIFSERFSRNYTWENLTGNYTGDSRALSDKERAIINGAYNNPPDYNDLYRELTRQIMEDFNYRMRQLYGR